MSLFCFNMFSGGLGLAFDQTSESVRGGSRNISEIHVYKIQECRVQNSELVILNDVSVNHSFILNTYSMEIYVILLL